MSRASLILAACVALAACDNPSPPAAQSADQFELKQDAQGRMLRLNKQTGEMAIVEGTKLVPITGGTPRPSLPAGSKKAAPQEPVPRSSSRPNGAPLAAAATPQFAAASQPGAPVSVGGAVAVTVAAPIFVTPNGNQVALTTARVGTVLPVLGVVSFPGL